MTEQNHRYRASQKELEYTYESAKRRMECHPDFAEKYQNIIQKCSYFKSEKEALEYATRMKKERQDKHFMVCATIEKDEEFYRINTPWIVTKNGEQQMAAEYIGMVLIADFL